MRDADPHVRGVRPVPTYIRRVTTGTRTAPTSSRAVIDLREDVRAGVPRRARLTYRRDIDGLRAIAIALVVAFHAGLAVVPGGYVGVDVFFVISGFLITGLLLDELERTGTISLADFYARRIRRLLPLSTPCPRRRPRSSPPWCCRR